MLLLLKDASVYSYEDCVQFGVNIGWLGLWTIRVAPYILYAFATVLLFWIWITDFLELTRRKKRRRQSKSR